MRKIFIAVGIVTIAIGVLWAGRAWNTLRVNARTAQFNTDVEDLFTALRGIQGSMVALTPLAAILKCPKPSRARTNKNDYHCRQRP